MDLPDDMPIRSTGCYYERDPYSTGRRALPKVGLTAVWLPQ